MLKQQFYIAELISRYLTGNITPDEEKELQQWKESSPVNKKLFHKLCDSENFRKYYMKRHQFDKDEGWILLTKKMRSLRRRNVVLKISRYAAVLVFPIIIGMLAYRQISEENSISTQLRNQLVQITPGEKKATLTLNDGQVIDLNNTEVKTMQEKDGTAILIDSTELNYKLVEKNKKLKEVIFNKIDVPHGGEYKMTLSDGTKVHLNSMTSLKFPVRFSGNKREVELEGEAYFDVSPEDEPFVVKYNNVAVQVLGTQFNVSAYANEESHTTLVNGSVKVTIGTGVSCVLKPSEQAYIESGSNDMHVRMVDTSLYTSWIDGRIYFKDERLEEIMNYLSRWYDMTVFYSEPSVKNLRFGCNVNRYDDIAPFLELLEETGKIKISVNGKTITFKHN